MNAATLAKLAQIVGSHYFIGPDDDQSRYIIERRALFDKRAAAVVIPGDVGQVQAIVQLANEADFALVPQSGNTGLVGGQVPYRDDEVIISLARLNACDPVNQSAKLMRVGAGVTLAQAQAHAEDAGLLYPLSLASQGSCMVGGNLASNAGGTDVLAYGNARALCGGIQAVLADGSLYDNMSGLRKDNTGYNLDQLIIGSEGTLGIITAANLRLFPKPIGFETALLAVASPADGLAILSLLQGAIGARVTALELMPEIAFEFLQSAERISRHPFEAPSPWYILAELSVFRDNEYGVLGELLEQAMDQGRIEDALIAQSEKDRAQFWAYREELSEVQKAIGGSIKNDVAVPVELTPELIARGLESVEGYLPGIRPVPFGHLGDGNIHFNFTAPVGMERDEFLTHWDGVCDRINEIVFSLGGSFSAEHGIGQLKAKTLAKVKDPAAFAAMRAIKKALDPKGILNPGKMFVD